MTATATIGVELDLASLEMRAKGIIGVIWLDLGGRAFPSTGWYDFPVVILSWWCDALVSFERATELEFMDGPCAVKLVSASDARVTVTLIDDDLEIPGGTLSIAAVRRAVHQGASALVAECARRGWQNDELQNLIKARARLQQRVQAA